MMMIRKLSYVLFGATVGFAAYDSWWRLYQKYKSVNYSVNGTIFFYSIIWAFFASVALILAENTTNKYDKKAIYMLLATYIFRFILNLAAINQDWDQYRILNDNWTIDLIQWLSVSAYLYINKWQRSTR